MEFENTRIDDRFISKGNSEYRIEVEDMEYDWTKVKHADFFAQAKNLEEMVSEINSDQHLRQHMEPISPPKPFNRVEIVI